MLDKRKKQKGQSRRGPGLNLVLARLSSTGGLLPVDTSFKLQAVEESRSWQGGRGCWYAFGRL